MDYIERNATEDVKDFTEELSEDVENATIRLASGSKGDCEKFLILQY